MGARDIVKYRPLSEVTERADRQLQLQRDALQRREDSILSRVNQIRFYLWTFQWPPAMTVGLGVPVGAILAGPVS